MANTKVDVDLGIQTTVMAIRERLMEYFKGTCVERFTSDSNVQLVNANRGQRAEFQYLRQEVDKQRPTIVTLGGLPIMTVQLYPERVVFHDKLLDRSPELKKVRGGVEDFLKKYLNGVEVSHSKKGVFYAN